MKVKTVTITGADDSVTAHDLIQLSDEFPFVEWGILFSKSSQGRARFPTQRWMNIVIPALAEKHIRLAAHLCGAWVRDLVLRGDFTWLYAYENIAKYFNRVQLNFHGHFHEQHQAFAPRIEHEPYQFIFQCDGVNDSAVLAAVSQKVGVPLFDRSGGAGVLPAEWPDSVTMCSDGYVGYAGGLGPDNVAQQLSVIEQQAGSNAFWIDMERNVRSEDDSRLDLAKVRRVLEIVKGGL